MVGTVGQFDSYQIHMIFFEEVFGILCGKSKNDQFFLFLIRTNA